MLHCAHSLSTKSDQRPCSPAILTIVYIPGSDLIMSELDETEQVEYSGPPTQR